MIGLHWWYYAAGIVTAVLCMFIGHWFAVWTI